MDEINPGGRYRTLGLFKDNETLYKIFLELESLERDAMMTHMFSFFEYERLKDVKPLKVGEMIVSLIKQRFLKVSNYSLTSEALRKAINYTLGENFEHETEFESKLISILSLIAKNDHTKVTAYSFVGFFSQVSERTKDAKTNDKNFSAQEHEPVSHYIKSIHGGNEKFESMRDDHFELFCFLKIVFGMVGIWWLTVEMILRLADPWQLGIDDFHETLERRINKHLIDTCYTDQNGQTIYHVIAAYDFARSFELLISAEDSVKALAQYKDKSGKVLSCIFVSLLCLLCLLCLLSFEFGLGVVSFFCQSKNFLFCFSFFSFFSFFFLNVFFVDGAVTN